MCCHDLEVLSSNPGRAKLAVHSTSVLSCSWSKYTMDIVKKLFNFFVSVAVVYLMVTVVSRMRDGSVPMSSTLLMDRRGTTLTLHVSFQIWLNLHLFSHMNETNLLMFYSSMCTKSYLEVCMCIPDSKMLFSKLELSFPKLQQIFFSS